MAKPGPAPKSPEERVAAGTNWPSRAVVHLFPNDPSAHRDPVRPKWLKGMARKIWDEKVARYAARGQRVAGCEDALAQYCALEAELIDMRRRKISPPIAMINAHRIYAGEFYDTPASQNVRV